MHIIQIIIVNYNNSTRSSISIIYKLLYCTEKIRLKIINKYVNTKMYMKSYQYNCVQQLKWY